MRYNEGLTIKYHNRKNHDGCEIHNYINILILAIFLLLFPTILPAAEEPVKSALTTQPAAEQPEKKPPPTQPISLSDITSRAAAERASLDQAEALIARSTIFDKIAKDLLNTEQAITRGIVSLRPSLAIASSRQAISEIEKSWLDLARRMDNTESSLSERTGVIQQQTSRLAVSLDVWKKTVKQAQDTQAPAELVTLASATYDDVGKIYGSLQQLQNRVFALQGKVGRARRGIQEALDSIKSEETNLIKNITHRDRPALWSEEVADVSLNDLIDRASKELNTWWSRILTVVKREFDRLGFQIFLLLVTAIVMFRARKAARTWVEDNPAKASDMLVFERPYAIAPLLVLLLTPLLFVSNSPALTDAVGLLLLLPVLWLVLPLIEAPMRPALFFLAILYVVDWLRDLVEAAPLVARYILIIEMVATIVMIVWLLRSKALHNIEDQPGKSGWHRYILLWLNVALFMVVISLLAAVSGYIRLAVLIGYGVLNSAYLAILLIALVRAGEAIISLALHSGFAHSMNIIHDRTQALRSRSKKLLVLIALSIWIIATLDLFAVWDYIFTTAKSILFSDVKIGAIMISLSDVLAFGVTIAVAILLARFIILVLDEDVYPRVELGRGVSFAISAVIKYSIIVVGFLLAVGAMGIGMDRITILLGAFGVGLGFGLQSIVNNFVSGMILIFERPIQIGDSVEVGSVKGKITKIGIRSSTVRSFEGADITIPNGTLLSDALTNWTMADRNRRIEINVGVAYGTDPDKVIEALQFALDGQEGLLPSPTPQILFNGFGDNSLDFILRAWVEDNDEYVSIRSKIALAMNRALDQYGIEIPFPQRDLHLRSISPEVRLPDTNQ